MRWVVGGQAIPRRTLARMVVPLFLILVLAGIDREPAVHAMLRAWREPAHLGVIVLNVLFALYAGHAGLDLVQRMLLGVLGPGHARSARRFLALVFDGVVAALAITAVGFNLSAFFVGGALTGVIVGLAAQAALSNIVAGIVLLFARPYHLGVTVSVQVGEAHYQGAVHEMGLVYTTLREADQEIRVPNSAMVAAVIVLSAPTPPDYRTGS